MNNKDAENKRENVQKICNRLIKNGYKLGLNLKQIAGEIGMAKTTLCKYRSGDGHPRPNMYIVLLNGDKKLSRMVEENSDLKMAC